jgi:hypothetical protein
VARGLLNRQPRRAPRTQRGLRPQPNLFSYLPRRSRRARRKSSIINHRLSIQRLPTTGNRRACHLSLVTSTCLSVAVDAPSNGPALERRTAYLKLPQPRRSAWASHPCDGCECPRPLTPSGYHPNSFRTVSTSQPDGVINSLYLACLSCRYYYIDPFAGSGELLFRPWRQSGVREILLPCQSSGE